VCESERDAAVFNRYMESVRVCVCVRERKGDKERGQSQRENRGGDSGRRGTSRDAAAFIRFKKRKKREIVCERERERDAAVFIRFRERERKKERGFVRVRERERETRLYSLDARTVYVCKRESERERDPVGNIAKEILGGETRLGMRLISSDLLRKRLRESLRERERLCMCEGERDRETLVCTSGVWGVYVCERENV